MINIDVVIPVFQSEKTAPKLVSRINDWTQTTTLKPHFIFVIDGCTDNSEQVLFDTLSTTNLNYKIISLVKNYGQHTATAIGMFNSTNKFIATIDDDLQHEPEVIDELYTNLMHQNADLIYGNYLNKQHHKSRNIGTWALQQLLKIEGKDYTMVTSCRLMKETVISSLKANQKKVFFIDDYLLLGSKSVKSCIVNHHKRNEGSSGYSYSKLTKMAINILLLHSSLPLKLISRMGLYMSLVFLLLGCFYIYKKVADDVAIGFTSLIVAIFFSTGLILFSLGIIGEYIRRIWITKQELDMVVVSKITSSNNV